MHRGQYLKGDRVWYQHQESNAWLGPVKVLHHREYKAWIYKGGNLIKVAACRVKPYELIPREKVEKKEVETLEETYSTSEEKLEKDDDEKTVEKFYIAKDAIGVKYMEMERSVCFFWKI